MASSQARWALLVATSFLVCAHAKSSSRPEALTPDQWTARYRCSLPATGNESSSNLVIQTREEKSAQIEQQVAWFKRVWFGIMDECNREQLAWRYTYIDELLDGFHQLVRDKNSDERLANIIYSLSISGIFDHNYFTFNSGDSAQDQANLLSVAGERVNDRQCTQDLTEMSNQLDELEARLERDRRSSDKDSAPLAEHQVRLARVLDSFGRYGSGSLDGLNRAIGSYSSCIGTSLLGSSRGEIGMRYCWAKLSLERQLNPLLRQRQRLSHEQAETGFSSAVCLPQSCHTRNLPAHHKFIQRLVNSQLVLPHSIYVNRSLELESVFCLVDEDSHFGMPLSGKLCVLFIFCWLALCLFASCKFKLKRTASLHEEMNQEKSTAIQIVPQAAMERRTKASRLQSVIECLDLSKSWHDFTSDKHQSDAMARVDLDTLNPLKICCMIFVVGTHSALSIGGFSDKPVELAASLERNFVYQAALLASTIVDSFFVLSGMLLTYLMLRKLSASRLKDQSLGFNWLMLASSRYLRLIPLYALMWWFRRDVLTYLGWGPFWDYGFNQNTHTGACKSDSWLTPFSFSDAFKPIQKACFLPSWSVSNDIFFCLLLPPFIVMLARRPRRTYYAMCTLIGASLLASIYHYTVVISAETRWELGEFRLHGAISFFGGLSPAYTWPIYRLPSFFVGSLAGHALYKFSSSKQGTWPRWLTRWGTKVSAGYLIVHTIASMYPIEIKNLIYPYQRLAAVHIVTSDRMLWSVANAILFLRMTTDWRESSLMREFAAQRWRSIARLNYCALFVHWILIIVQIGTMTTLPNFNHWEVWSSFASIYCLTLPISLAAHVLFENPLDKLIKRQVFKL